MTRVKKMSSLKSPLETPSTRIPPDAAAARDHPAMATGTAAAFAAFVVVGHGCLLASKPGVARRPRPASADMISFIGADRQLVIFVIRALIIRTHATARAVLIAWGQCARGSKFLRRPDRANSVGAVKLVCTSARKAVRPREGSGLSNARDLSATRTILKI
jgi:hypothetical protein